MCMAPFSLVYFELEWIVEFRNMLLCKWYIGRAKFVAAFCSTKILDVLTPTGFRYKILFENEMQKVEQNTQFIHFKAQAPRPVYFL